MAYGADSADLLDIPLGDDRYRKRLEIDGDGVFGFASFPNEAGTNMWLDGTGHMACALRAAGRAEEANFWADHVFFSNFTGPSHMFRPLT